MFIFTDILGRNNRWLAAYMIPPHRRAHPFFPKIRPHAPDTLQTPLHHRLVGWEGRNACYGWLPVGTERDSKFAIKSRDGYFSLCMLFWNQLDPRSWSIG